MQYHQSTFRKTMLTLLATLSIVRTADILKGVQIPENPDINFIADKAFCFETLQNYCGFSGEVMTLKKCYKYVILTWVYNEMWDSVENVYVREKVIDIITRYNAFNEHFIDVEGIQSRKNFCETRTKEKFYEDPDSKTDAEWVKEKNQCFDSLKLFGDSNKEAYTYALTETKSGNCTYENEYLNHIADNITIKNGKYSYGYFCEEVYKDKSRLALLMGSGSNDKFSSTTKNSAPGSPELEDDIEYQYLLNGSK